MARQAIAAENQNNEENKVPQWAIHTHRSFPFFARLCGDSRWL
jgi:hypothetical protein